MQPELYAFLVRTGCEHKSPEEYVVIARSFGEAESILGDPDTVSIQKVVQAAVKMQRPV